MDGNTLKNLIVNDLQVIADMILELPEVKAPLEIRKKMLAMIDNIKKWEVTK